MGFLEDLENMGNLTKTENNAVALKSTKDNLLDLYTKVGVMRESDDSRIISSFYKAFNQDKELALKILFYARDIRGGLGERKVFRTIIKDLGNNYPDIVRKFIPLIGKYGRYDDLYSLDNTKVEDYMYGFITKQLNKDKKARKNDEEVSLLAKWLKSLQVSNIEGRKLAKKTAIKLGLTQKKYRKTLAKLRKYIDVTERKMATQKWDKIEYSSVPSNCMYKNRKAFEKHDKVRFDEFIVKVENGEETINSTTLYPYNILEGIEFNHNWNEGSFSCNSDAVLEAQWKALPNYVEGENNVLIMADTSGSMSGRPMVTAIGLAIYFAERNKGAYKNKFMTFSSQPSFVTLNGSNLRENIMCVPSIVSNTDLEKAFQLILATAVKNQISQDEVPKALIVISDMQFDSATAKYGENDHNTWHEKMEQMFASYGYEIPNIVYWNVRDSKDSYQTTSDKQGVQIVSGQATAIFKSVMANIGKTPYEAMIQTLSKYEDVVL